MKVTSTALALFTASLANAHYTFSDLVVNGEQVGSAWQYIREHTRSFQPTKGSDILSDDFRCNQGASSGADTEVYTVKPGDKIAMKQAFGGTGMAHPGPVQVYVSKAPNDDVKSYDGSGDWVKVFEDLLCKSGDPKALQTDAWCMWKEDRIEFTMPDTLPAGEYLVRAEHLAIHGAHDGQAEFYYSCAQVKLDGSSASSVPGPSVKIPGVYQVDDAAINFSVWGSATSYPEAPGPEVVSGGQQRGSADGTDSSIKTIGGSGSASETPASDSDSETPTSETPATGSETPASGSETPAPGSETPAPGSETPATGETPTSGSETPATGSESPATGGETPTGTETPASGETPTTGTETPATGGETPAIGETPAAGSGNPASGNGNALEQDVGDGSADSEICPYHGSSAARARAVVAA